MGQRDRREGRHATRRGESKLVTTLEQVRIVRLPVGAYLRAERRRRAAPRYMSRPSAPPARWYTPNATSVATTIAPNTSAAVS